MKQDEFRLQASSHFDESTRWRKRKTNMTKNGIDKVYKHYEKIYYFLFINKKIYYLL